MSDDNNELSDEEYDALLRDLEGRAADGGSAAGGGEDLDSDADMADIDAFLSDIESEAESKSKTTTATRDDDDDLAREFSALEEKGELTAPADKKQSSAKKKKKTKKKKKKSSDKEKTGERSRGAQIALTGLLAAIWVIPALVFWWVLGAYLGLWVSAAWLVALVSAGVVFGLPAAARRLVKRGNYRRWLLGVSLVATVALVAPMPNTAGEQLSSYGHWPSSVIAEVTGADADIGVVRTHAAAAGWLGELVATEQDPQWEARQLGTVFPLGMQWPPDAETLELLEEGAEIVDPDELGDFDDIDEVLQELEEIDIDLE